MEDDLEIIFKEKKIEYFNPNHDTDLIVSMWMINARVKRVMIDTSGSTDILYFDAFQKFRLLTNGLTPMTSSLTRLTSDSILPLGTVNLYVTFECMAYSKIISSKFIVVDIPLAYNAIIGQPTLNKLRAMVSIYHIVMKFPIKTNIGELRSNIRESH